jgi:hypothetical protein
MVAATEWCGFFFLGLWPRTQCVFGDTVLKFFECLVSDAKQKVTSFRSYGIEPTVPTE